MNRGKTKTVSAKAQSEREHHIESVCEGLLVGMPIAHACARADITLSTFTEWVNSDITLRSRVDSALAKSMHGPLSSIQRAHQERDQWQAAAWFLERKFPNEFGRVDRLRIDGLSDYAESLAERLGLDVESSELLAEAELLAAESVIEGRVVRD